MAIAALVVAIVAALAAVGSFWFARRSARAADRSAVAAEKSAGAAEKSAALETARRHDELAPRFRVSVGPWSHFIGEKTRELTVFLAGPPELGRLDALTVRIRDDRLGRPERPARRRGARPAAPQVWGPYRFTPGTGPGADPDRGIPGADPTGRVTPTGGMPVGESLPFQLEATRHTPEAALVQAGTVLRLQLEARRGGVGAVDADV